jgi:hypothetical protein
VEGVGHAIVLAGLPDDWVAVVLAAVMHGHPDSEGEGGFPLPDRLAAVAAQLRTEPGPAGQSATDKVNGLPKGRY